MKTDDLINMLASGPDTRAAPFPVARCVLMVGGGMLLAAVLLVALLGVRADLSLAAAQPSFWQKLLYCAAVAIAGAYALSRLARPGARTSALPVLLALPLVLISILAVLAVLAAAPEARPGLLWGVTWKVCPWLIAALSAPVMLAIVGVLKLLAPTRLRLTGAVAGLTSGALAAAVYCLHCPEVGSPFVACWYTLGMLIPAALGALIAPRVLAW